MKHSILRTGLSVLLLLAILAASLPAVFAAEGSNLYITGYRVTNSAGTTVYSITKGSVVDITVSIKDTGDGTGQNDPKALDITKLDDSFTGGVLFVEKTSAPDAPLVYAVHLTGLTYKGVGQNLKLQVGTAGQPDSYQTLELTITEAVVYEAPQPTPEPVPTPPEPIPAPTVLVSRSAMDKPIEAGQSIPVTIIFENLSRTRLTSPVVTFTPTDGISIAGGSSSFPLPDIAGKKSVSLTVMVQASSTIPSPAQSLGVDLKFNYFNNVSTVQGTMTDKINIPALGRDSVPQPVVLITRSPLERPLAPEESATITMQFQNTSSTRLVKPVVAITPSESLMVLNDAATFLLPDIDPGKTVSIAVRVQAARGNTTTSQSLSAELKFGYDNGGMLTQATSSDKVNLSTNVPSKADASVPNVVVRSFSFGEGSVAAGSAFPLGITFENTGAVRIENVVLTVDGGDTFTMDAGTNTFFYKAIGPGGNQAQTIPMRVIPTGKTGAQSISLSFKYEYMDGEKRSQTTSDIKLSLPVYQPDRFQINAPAVPESVNVGEETELLLAYVNKGKDDLANLEATVVGDDVETPARTQYLGNVTAGANGNIGFALTPMTEGDINVVLKISYENADQQVQTREFPVTLHVTAAPPPEDFPDDFDPAAEEGGFPWLPVGLAAGGAVLAGGAGFLIWKKKRDSKAAGTDSWDDWDDTSSNGEA
ncbi:hypothetical protein [Flavonifractor sp. AGMB03687]|uniref:COG1361 S-layer family protein n=1 Tax=Flavonifractor sp. AGMB03687 TaxID=2785133 RepID=UPI001AE038DF|nr:hypothetical protein [Flavonifractor sp. AGMB03687]